MAKKSVSAFDLAKRGQDENAATPSTVQNGMQALDAGAMLRARFTDEGMQIGPFLLKSDRLDVVGDPSYEQWLEIGARIARWDDALQWWIGDWAHYAYHTWGIGYEQIAERADFYTYGTIKNCASITSRIPASFRPQSLRSDRLNWNHYVVLAGMSENDLRYWLDRVVEENLSARALAKLVNPPALPEPMALTDRKNKRVFNRVWRALESGGGGLKREDVEQLERWVSELRKSLG